MQLLAKRCHVRVCTIFGTALYLDEASGELRHGAIEASPANAVLTLDQRALAKGGQGLLGHRGGGSSRPIICSAERSWSLASADASAAAAAPAAFEVVPLAGGLAGLRAGGFYLCAEVDGRVTHSRTECGRWEQFRLVDADSRTAALAEIAAMDRETLGPEPVSTRYHLGCGGHFIPGYLNIDWGADAEPDCVHRDFGGVPGAYFFNYDLSNGLPGADNSLDVIYHCHFLEHLTYPDAIKLLQQARFRLKPGAIMRLLVPDLELWVANYHHDNFSFFEAYRRQILNDDAILFKTKGSIFMGMLHNWGHHWGYDFETIKWLLEKVGFTNVRRTLFQESRIADIAAVEPYSPLRGMESLCVECEKPAASAA